MFGRKSEAEAPRNEPIRREPPREEPRLRTMPRPVMPAAPLSRPDAARRLAEAAALRRPEPLAEPLPEPPPRTATPDPNRLVIDRGITLSGEISACEQLVVEGRVEASLSRASSLEVAASGQFKGSAAVDSAEIFGLFEGELTVRRRLVIHSGGRASGTIRCGEIEVERGGRLSGKVEELTPPAGAPRG
jgi:cytoskeletal protein CcmA (bactofilin family)